jgi:hypothetical protein
VLKRRTGKGESPKAFVNGQFHQKTGVSLRRVYETVKLFWNVFSTGLVQCHSFIFFFFLFLSGSINGQDHCSKHLGNGTMRSKDEATTALLKIGRSTDQAQSNIETNSYLYIK